MLRRFPVVSLLWIFAGGAACTSMLGIDGDYEPAGLTPGAGGDVADPGSGSTTGSGASSESGGAWAVPDTGGAGGTAGAGGITPMQTGGVAVDAGMCAPGNCGPAEKCCPGIASACVPQSPLVGCGRDDCNACPAPPDNGIEVCKLGDCAVQCNDGYKQQGDQCVPNGTGGSGSGGAGGAKGSGGAPGTGGTVACDPKKCGGCSFVGPIACCRNNNTCGCTWDPTIHACY